MPDPELTVRTAGPSDLARVEALLEANELPSRDVRTSPGRFFVASTESDLVGVGGVETYGSHGLLRSVVIVDSARGEGYGARLCDALEAYARKNGVETMFLLTTTAVEFFQGRGYDVVARETVPSSIRQTTEFTELCSSAATCMKKVVR